MVCQPCCLRTSLGSISRSFHCSILSPSTHRDHVENHPAISKPVASNHHHSSPPNLIPPSSFSPTSPHPQAAPKIFPKLLQILSHSVGLSRAAGDPAPEVLQLHADIQRRCVCVYRIMVESMQTVSDTGMGQIFAQLIQPSLAPWLQLFAAALEPQASSPLQSDGVRLEVCKALAGLQAYFPSQVAETMPPMFQAVRWVWRAEERSCSQERETFGCSVGECGCVWMCVGGGGKGETADGHSVSSIVLTNIMKDSIAQIQSRFPG